MQPRRKSPAAWTVVAGLAAGALLLAACGSSTSTTTTSSPSGTTKAPTKVPGGTVYWAEPPQLPPNWIFPFTGLQYFSVANTTQFQYLMYRPLYWFGPYGSTAPTVDYTMSPANAPVWSNGGKTVTVSLKGWKFNDGQPVDAQSVVFWMNMMKAEGCYPEPTCSKNLQWAGSVPGTQAFPGNIVSYSAPGGATGDTVVFNLSETFSTNWYLYNELSQITPMAEAWDVTSLTAAAGSGGCGKVSPGDMTGSATLTACEAVWKFDTDNGGLNKSPQMTGDEGTYATNKLWQEGANGPWLLTGFQASSGEATFTPNPNYSGPGKPIISTFVEVPYSSDTAEYNALAAGGKNAPDVGYLPPQNTPQKSPSLPPTQAGQNAPTLQPTYNLDEAEAWQINYFPENFDSTFGANGHAGAVFRQLYFRQALQELVNQPGIISTYFKGYGVPTYGPAPVYPANPFVSTEETKPGGPYPFSESNAISLLKANGWTVNPGGTTVCAKPGTASGDCGKGVPSGTPLKFQEVYASGSQSLTQTVDYEVSEWAKAGIQVSLIARPFNDVLKVAVACPPGMAPTKACQSWDMANWGGGWLYAPDYLPTGEEIFATGAGSNSGDYSDPKNDSLIIQTNRNSSMSIFDTWENYLADQLPVIWQPLAASEVEVAKNLYGVTPVNALDNLNPEYWYFTSTATP